MRLVVFEDGELLRTITDLNFHSHFEVRQKDWELARIDALIAERRRCGSRRSASQRFACKGEI